jgi:hypothetical protein
MAGGFSDIDQAGFVIMRKPIGHGGHMAKGRPLDERDGG